MLIRQRGTAHRRRSARRSSVFGNAIGNDLSGVDAYRQWQVQYQQQQQQAAIAALSPAQRDNYTLLLQRGLAPAQALALATHLAAAAVRPMISTEIQRRLYSQPPSLLQPPSTVIVDGDTL